MWKINGMATKNHHRLGQALVKTQIWDPHKAGTGTLKLPGVSKK
jgi:hypothetical protein